MMVRWPPTLTLWVPLAFVFAFFPLLPGVEAADWWNTSYSYRVGNSSRFDVPANVSWAFPRIAAPSNWAPSSAVVVCDGVKMESGNQSEFNSSFIPPIRVAQNKTAVGSVECFVYYGGVGSPGVHGPHDSGVWAEDWSNISDWTNNSALVTTFLNNTVRVQTDDADNKEYIVRALPFGTRPFLLEFRGITSELASSNHCGILVDDATSDGLCTGFGGTALFNILNPNPSGTHQVTTGDSGSYANVGGVWPESSLAGIRFLRNASGAYVYVNGTLRDSGNSGVQSFEVSQVLLGGTTSAVAPSGDNSYGIIVAYVPLNSTDYFMPASWGAEEASGVSISMAFVSPTQGNASAVSVSWFAVNVTVNSTNNVDRVWSEVQYPDGTYANYTMTQTNLTSGGLPSKNISAFFNFSNPVEMDTEYQASGGANAYDEDWGTLVSLSVTTILENFSVGAGISTQLKSKFGDAIESGDASTECYGTSWIIIANITDPTEGNYTNAIPAQCQISPVQIRIRRTSGGISNVQYYESLLILPNLTNGTYQYRVHANDANGNSNMTPLNNWRTIYVESPSTTPLVTNTSPLNQSYLTLGPHWANVSLIESNPDTMTAEIHSANGTTFNLTMTNSSGNWNTRFHASAGSNYVRFIAVDRLGNVNGTQTVYFTVTNASIVNTAPANNTQVYNGQVVSFKLIPTSGIAWSNASLYYDGIRVAGITSVTNGSNNTITHTMPSTNGVRSWYAQACSSATGAGCITGPTWQVNVTTKISPTDCTGGITNNHFLRVNTTNEEDYGAVRNTTIAAVLTFYDTAINYYTNYSFTNSTGNTLDVCVDSTRLGESLDVDITASSGSTWPLASWYLRDHNVSGVTHNITVALVNTSIGTLSQVYVVDKGGSQAEDWYVAVLDYDFTTGSWRQLRHAKTDYTGKLSLYLRQNDNFYSFQIYDSDMGFRFTKSNLIVGAATVTLSEPVSSSSALSKSRNIVASCTNTTTTLSCTVTDNNDPRAMTRAHLRVWRGGALNWSISCETNSTLNPAVLECPVTTDRVYWASVYADINPSKINLLSLFVGGTPGSRLWGRGGVISMAVFALAFGYIGSRRREMMPIFLVLGYGFGGLLGLLSPNLTSLGVFSSLFLFAGIVSLRVSKP